MITVVPQTGLGELLGAGLGQGISNQLVRKQELADKLEFEREKQKGTLAEKLMAAQLQEQKQQEKSQALEQLGLDPALAALDPRIAQEYVKDKLYNQMFGLSPSSGMETFDEQKIQENIDVSPSGIQATISNKLERMPDSQLRQMVGHPRFGKVAESEIKRREREQDILRQQSLEDRKYHTDFSKELEKNINNLRDVLPKKENALEFARNSIETGNLGFFSLDKLADTTGIDLFRTAKGAQLVTAGKENLLNNMGRVSARAQNIWFEQRLNSMFPKIGQSKEANQTIAEMLEGENALDRAYLEKFDQIAEDDEKNYGYVRKDISKRAHNEIKDLEKHIFNRTSYRLKDIEEREKGLKSLKKDVGKKVVKGTPLTLTMAKLYKDKFGEKALEVAKENGYLIPTYEEFQSYNLRPSEFRETL